LAAAVAAAVSVASAVVAEAPVLVQLPVVAEPLLQQAQVVADLPPAARRPVEAVEAAVSEVALLPNRSFSAATASSTT
jgi:hypothetical protein